MSSRSRTRQRGSATCVALVAALTGLLAAPAASGSASATPLGTRGSGDGGYRPTTAALSGTPTRNVSYRGVGVQVPASWSVVDLDRHPGACVRLDRDVVYLGEASADQHCPAHLVGRGDSVWLAPQSARDRADATEAVAGGAGSGLALHAGPRTVSAQRTILAGSAVAIRAADAGDPAVVDAVVASAHATTTRDSTDEAGSWPAPASHTGTDGTWERGTPRHATPRTAAPIADVRLTGMAFDTCAAPSTATMAAWRASPYSTVGIYIGGSQRACGDGNLSASWVSTVRGQGWGLIPTYVGLQAPCTVSTKGRFSSTPATAAGQATEAADDAVAAAQRLGLPAGTTIHYDLEHYDVGTSTTCRPAVLAFVTAWVTRVRALGYRAGTYGNASSLMVDMSTAVASGSSSFAPPDQVWYARYDTLQTVSAQSQYPAFKDSYWSRGQRLHQYRGDFTETWGGVTIAIDGDWVDGAVGGDPVQAAYPPGALGPGSAGFVFTGPMTSWRPQPGQGVLARSYWTNPTGTSAESNGATWSPALTSGTYLVQAYVPAGGSTGAARYTLTSAAGTSATTVNQASVKGYRTIGTVVVTSSTPARIHLGDNGGGSTSLTIAADAMLFTRIAGPAGRVVAVTPSRVADTRTGTTANGRATPLAAGETATFRIAGVGGSPLAADAAAAVVNVTATGATSGGYLRVSPAGASTSTVSFAAGQTVADLALTGLRTDGTVQVTNGSSSPVHVLLDVEAEIRAGTAGGLWNAVTPMRILDTRAGTTPNPAHMAVAPGKSLTVGVAGRSGSPVPSGAASVALTMTATGATGSGYLTVTSGATTSSSALNLTPGRTVANLAVSALSSSGTVTVTNRSTGSVQLLADVLGYAAGTGQAVSAILPTRIADTRSGTVANPTRTAIAAKASVTFRVAGASGTGVPAGARAAALTVTATGATATGYLRVADTATGVSSTASFMAGSSTAVLSLVRLSSSGTVAVTNGSSQPVHVILDATGYAGP